MSQERQGMTVGMNVQRPDQTKWDTCQNYTCSTNSKSDQGYTGSKPAGAYWPLTPNSDNVYPGHSSENLPPAIPFNYNATNEIISIPGIGADPLTIKGNDSNDKAIRLIGVDGACLIINNYNESCLFDPTSCPLGDDATGTKGLSFSIWLNVPHSFETRRQYIIDTGANDQGVKGISMYLVNSLDGFSFSNSLTVTVSTGDQIWSVVLNGMIKANFWTNVGVRWSMGTDTNGTIYGLQVFINKVSTGWKRYPVPTANASVDNGQILTLGCDINGHSALNGRLDEFAIWYWRLRDKSDNDRLKFEELEYFDGDLEYTGSYQLCIDEPDICFPNQFPLTNQSDKEMDIKNEQLHFDEDVTPAIDGDCDPNNYGTWGTLHHPIKCADTKNEMEKAINFNNDFKALDFVNAMARTCNKAGPRGLSLTDILWLNDNFYIYGLHKLIKENISSNTSTSDIAQLLAPVECASKLTEKNLYYDLWHSEELDLKRAGLTAFMDRFRAWLKTLGWLLPVDHGVVATSNHTVVAVTKIISDDITGPFVFPIYTDSLINFNFLDQDAKPYWNRKNPNLHWKGCEDQLIVSKDAFASGWPTNGTANITVVGRLFNMYQEMIPAFLDEQIINLGNSKWIVNSRILSFWVFPPPIDGAFNKYSIKFTVQHRLMQNELPFRKGAILCAYWKDNDPLNNDNSTINSIGAWDIDKCETIMTNDSHTICACSVMANYAVMMEHREFHIPQIAYLVCLGLGLLSILVLVIFMHSIIRHPQVHNLLHIIYANISLAITLALIFYLVANWLNNGSLICIVLSVLQHYAYCSGYAWQALAGVCLVRVTCIRGSSGTNGIELIKRFSILGWLVPGILVSVMVGVNANLYGFGDRCFASPYRHYNAVYFGTFFLFFLVSFISILASLIGRHKFYHNETMTINIKYAIIGNGILIIFNVAIWSMPILVYILATLSEIPDFIFELLNCLQGIVIFICLGIFNPMFRQAIAEGVPEEYKDDYDDDYDNIHHVGARKKKRRGGGTKFTRGLQ